MFGTLKSNTGIIRNKRITRLIDLKIVLPVTRIQETGLKIIFADHAVNRCPADIQLISHLDCIFVILF